MIIINKGRMYYKLNKTDLLDLSGITLRPLYNEKHEEIKHVFDFQGKDIKEEMIANMAYSVKKFFLDKGIGKEISEKTFQKYNIIL